MIHVENLQKKYHGKMVVDIPELEIDAQEIFGLVGNNGAGKTTFLRLILDLVQASSGKVKSKNNEVSKTESWKSYTGSYLDEGFIIDFLKPREFFSFIGSTYKMSKEQVFNSLKRFAPFFNNEIPGSEKRCIREFSRGSIQKIGIASAMLCEPEVLILDEPFANLDPTSQNFLKRLLKEQKERTRTTVILSSHNLDHVSDLCTRIAIMEKGRILKDMLNDGTTRQELEKYFEPNF